MEIDINRIPPEGIILFEEVSAGELDLETEIVKFRTPIKIKADVSRITNAVSVGIELQAVICMNCSRCLKEIEANFKKHLSLNYSVSAQEVLIDTSAVSKSRPSGRGKEKPLSINPEQASGFSPRRGEWIDLVPDIREEVILDYPIKPLCEINCKGLCSKCGKNLNPERIAPPIPLKEGSNEGGCNCAVTKEKTFKGAR